ncbi:MAG: hypothetical protein GY755_07580 [Chloroflexi bacterium]|nr:hypothetical protein [Chloroflexota bacterium]
MTKQRNQTILNWSIVGVLMLLFLIWHGAFESPISPAEVDLYVERYQVQHPEADTNNLRNFLEEDDGKPVVMVNNIKLYDTPIEVNGQSFGATSEEALSEYTSFVIPYLIKRGSYPLYSGNAVFESMEKWGIENAEEWSSGALMRYRSRRVMIEMATDPVFDQFHDAKLSAIEKTFAFPATTVVSTGNLALTVGLGLLSLAFGMQLLINSKENEIRD